MIKAIWNGTVVAESDATIEVEGNAYFPAESIQCDFFAPSDKTSVCGWKGTAHYYTLLVDGEENVDAAWTYPEPKDAAKNIAGHFAFWKGVQIEA